MNANMSHAFANEIIWLLFSFNLSSYWVSERNMTSAEFANLLVKSKTTPSSPCFSHEARCVRSLTLIPMLGRYWYMVSINFSDFYFVCKTFYSFHNIWHLLKAFVLFNDHYTYCLPSRNLHYIVLSSRAKPRWSDINSQRLHLSKLHKQCM